MMDVDSAYEETDPLASSGMSISSLEDGMSGEKRRKSKSALSRLRKFKKPEINGPIGSFAPRPPSDKPAWNSPRINDTPNGIDHKEDETKGEEIDPFTGEIKKTRKKKDNLFTSTSNEPESPQNDEDEFEEKIDPFTGGVKRTKKKKDPFITMSSVDVEEDVDDKIDTESLNSRPVGIPKKDPFIAMNSVDFSNPSEELKDDPLPKEESRTSNKKDPFTAMNSVDFSSPETSEVITSSTEEKTLFRQRDPFTAMNSIDFTSKNDKKVDDFTSQQNRNVIKSENDNDEEQNNNYGSNQLTSSALIEDNRTLEDANEIMNIEEVNEADDETGEEPFEPRTTADGSDDIEDAFTIAEKPRPESEVICLSDDLLKSTDTDGDEKDQKALPLGRSGRLSPLQEQSSQEQSSPERVQDEQSNKRINNRSPLLYRKSGDEIERNKNQEAEIVNQQEQANVIAEIETESDSDDLVVMPSLSKPAIKPLYNEPVATSTPMKVEVPQILEPTPVPRLNLEEVIRSDEELDDDHITGANDTYTMNKPEDLRTVNSDDEDEAIGLGSDSGSIGSGTLKANEFVPVHQADVTETESEIIVRRKNRTSNTPDARSLSSESGSSGIMKRGRLSPIAPSKAPPPLEDNYTSHVLRTTYKKDDLNHSMVLSEPIMRSRGELSDTNRSFLSTGALPQISTKQARNRSFLSGGMRNTGSLLGKEELERFFPDRKLSIFVATWNMCELKVLPDNLEDLLLPEYSPYDIMHDMYVIGSQESSADGSEWEISLQETLGPSHVLLNAATHGVLRLLIFIRRDLIWFCSPVEEDLVSTRAFSMIKTKGAVAASFTFFGTSFLFINAHFTSGDENLDDRIQDFDKICKGLQLPNKVEPTKKYNTLTTDVTTRFDCVFWCGDFNFRLSESRQKVENWANQLREGDRSDFNVLLQHDQLRKAMNKNEIFKGFQEGAIQFIPSYKFDINDEDDTYDTSEKQRVPSYTDRVLFKSRKKGDISVLHYNSCMGIKASDHKPVCGVYQAQIRPGKEDMTLGGGQFSRNVFIEANKRRAARAGMSSTLKTQQASSVCSVM